MAESATHLATLDRDGFPETYHWGWLVLTDDSGSPVYCTPDAPGKACFWRSSAKPFQLLPLIEDIPDHGLTIEEIAVACASHVASEYHLQIVENLLRKAGLDSQLLDCGPHAPIDSTMQRQLIKAEKKPSKVHNNCSGKHAAMLYHCVKKGWDIGEYLHPDHPLQQRILQTVKKFCGSDEAGIAIDGCGAPTYYLPLSAYARAFGQLGVDAAFAPIRNAVTRYPVLIGGEGRLDTAIIAATDGAVISKVGADGLLCASRVGTGEGLAIKIADGDGDVRDKLVAALLVKLGWINGEQSKHPDLAPFLNCDRVNTQGKTVGKIRFDFLESGLLETYAPEIVC